MSALTNPTAYVYVPLHVELYAELVRRSGRADIHGFIEHGVQTFLDRTEGDADLWSAEYIEKVAEEEDDAFLEKFGNPTRGYQWQNVFLPNGSRLRMAYRGGTKYAEVRHEKLYFGDKTVSPSEFARQVANNTNRNAWRDIYVQFPGEAAWKFADDLRRQKR